MAKKDPVRELFVMFHNFFIKKDVEAQKNFRTSKGDDTYWGQHEAYSKTIEYVEEEAKKRGYRI